MKPLLLSCRTATELMEKKHVAPLSAWQKFQLWMHTLICDACRRYQIQSDQIDKILKYKFHQPSNFEPLVEDVKTLKDQILKKLDA